MTAEALKRAGTAQSRLGGIQDLEVLLADLRGWIEKKKARAAGLETVLNRLESQRQKSVSEFMKGVGDISGLWKLPQG
jgi:CHAD domain-containing protein